MHKIFAVLIGALIAVAVGGFILTRFQMTRNLVFGNPSTNTGMFQP